MTKAYTYQIIVDAVTTPITLAEVKAHLRLNPADTSEDAALTVFIKAVTRYAESYTGREFINKTFLTYRDCFYPDCCDSYGMLLKRSKLQTINSIKYTDRDSVLQTVSSSVYYNTISNDFSSVHLNEGQSWPDDITNRLQAVQIEFVAGYGAAAASVPEELKVAMLNHVAALYANRGDCSDGVCDCGANLPAESQSLYGMYRIVDIRNCF